MSPSIGELYTGSLLCSTLVYATALLASWPAASPSPMSAYTTFSLLAAIVSAASRSSSALAALTAAATPCSAPSCSFAAFASTAAFPTASALTAVASSATPASESVTALVTPSRPATCAAPTSSAGIVAPISAATLFNAVIMLLKSSTYCTSSMAASGCTAAPSDVSVAGDATPSVPDVATEM